MPKRIYLIIAILFHLIQLQSQEPTKISVRRINPNEMELKDKANNISYRYVKLGNQTWTLPSIKNKRYNDGEKIPRIYGDIVFDSTRIAAFRITTATLKNSYGYVYNGYAVATNKLCPVGWRAGTIDDYLELARYLESKPIANSKYGHMVDTLKYEVNEGRQIRCIKEE